MHRTETMASAGLIFQGLRDLDIVKIGNRVSKAFETLEQTVTGVRILSHDRACISSDHHNVTVQVREDQLVDGLPTPAPLMLEVAIETAPTTGAAALHRDTVLAHALKSLHGALAPDHVKWVTPGAVLSNADFLMATNPPEGPQDTPQAKPQVTIRRNAAGIIERRYELPNIEETNNLLQERLSQKAVLSIESGKQQSFCAAILEDIESIGIPDADEDIREDSAPLRLTVWMVSFTIALFSLPVGAALLVFNVLKGENLRLSAQVAALTGTFISLETDGATAQAMAAVQGLVG